MTRLWNDPADFADEMIARIRRRERPLRPPRPRRRRAQSPSSPDGQVAVVIGGGSGHYPAFGGLVGQGLAHGAAMGNLFASPSTQQVHSVATAAAAAAAACSSPTATTPATCSTSTPRRSGCAPRASPCETVTVTDDISSALARREAQAPRHRRRPHGVPASPAAAAEAGYDLDGVTRVARLANERTRSFGVAFTGCTLPGAEQPLFSVPEGRMAVGLGIHGEPGIDETDVPTADGLAELLVARLLDELPDGVAARSGRPRRADPQRPRLAQVRGAVRRLPAHRRAARARRASRSSTRTSASTARASTWPAPRSRCSGWTTSSSGSGTRPSTPPRTAAARSSRPRTTTSPPRTSRPTLESSRRRDEASRAAAATVAGAVVADRRRHDRRARRRARPPRRDRRRRRPRHRHAARRRTPPRAAAQAPPSAAPAPARCSRAPATPGRTAPAAPPARCGASSSRALGETLGDEDAPERGIRRRRRRRRGATASRAYGKAEVGDKTMVDALVPFSADAHARASTPAHRSPPRGRPPRTPPPAAAAATADLLPRMGRARPHAEKSLGTPDPGAHSLALIVTAVGDVLVERVRRKELTWNTA